MTIPCLIDDKGMHPGKSLHSYPIDLEVPEPIRFLTVRSEHIPKTKDKVAPFSECYYD
jgi:hypothetical protein